MNNSQCAKYKYLRDYKVREMALVGSQMSKRKGHGFLNKIIDKLPVELHIPNYRFCGPGTKLAKRLQRRDQPINKVDLACREHDILYSLFNDDESRRMADKKLASKASERFKAEDASVGEKLAALGVGGAMKLKSMLGMGMKSTGQRTIRRRKKQRPTKVTGGRVKTVTKKHKRKRLLPIAKRGGFLPFLLPILGAIGALSGGTAGIVNAVQSSKAKQQALAEQKRHNAAMEEATKGRGLYLKPYTNFKSRTPKGQGLYLRPYQKNL